MIKWFLALCCVCISINSLYAADVTQYVFKQNVYWVFQPKDLSKLKLGLKDPSGDFLHGFKQWQKTLQASCDQLTFAMNAGMFHPNYSPVGLYLEQGKTYYPINQDDGFGNFFLKPNGILAWNKNTTFVGTTEQWLKSDFNVDYATQSGPMLVINGQINSQFFENSKSKKVRNGVGSKQGKLYFVISEGPVNFYEFAEFFQQQFDVEHALYLDGSISNVYPDRPIKQNRTSLFGPMIGYVEKQCL